MVTNLPIMVGDPVVCQVIVAARFADPLMGAAATSYSYDRFVPVGYAFQAKYNDYGYVEDIEEDIYTADTLSYIRDHLVEREQGENPYHEQEVKKDLLTWKTFGEWIHDGRVLFANAAARAYPQYPRFRPVGMAMIHEMAYDAMTSHKIGQSWGMEDVIKEALSIPINAIRTEFTVKDKLFNFTKNREMNSPIYLEGADIDEITRRLSRMIHFEGNLNRSRKQWYPVSGAGSQSEEFDLFRTLAVAAEHIMKQRETEIAED
jgi:hypothetical protein